MSALTARVRQLAPRREDWTQARPRRDLTAGVMVALVALPLALGFGVSSGVGAGAGIVTAVVAGAVAAVFGGSHVQVSGPTGAMTVVLIPIVAAHGVDGVLVVGLLAGLMLLVLAVTGAGRAIRYVPVTVIEGFTAGIAVIIALQQLPAALGVDVHAERILVLAGDAVRAWVAEPDLTAPATAVLVAAVIVAFARLRAGFPAALVLVALATGANALLGRDGERPLDTIGTIPSGLPAPRLPSVPWGDLDTLVLAAVAVATLGALESLLSATVADAMSVGQRHDPDRELLGQGLANVASPLFGGIPATAAIARTAVNVRSGAHSRLAALSHAVLLLIVVLVAAQWVGHIPLAALAGVLIATAVQMVRISSLGPLLRATRGDAATLLITAVATVALDLVLAVIIGLVAAGFFALRETATTARLEEVPLDESDHHDEERRLLDEHIVAYRLDGPLFFAAAHDFLLELTQVKQVRVVVLRMSRLTTVDATGAHVLADTIERLERRGVTVLLSGTRPAHLAVLERLGVRHRLAHERHVFATTPEAIAHARLHAARVAHDAGTSTPAG
ncbi:SulP family inorganic anion transporter [Nocardioides carbamazepini]|uniref:SulP family inorganic anion transporter n=1 Tax=Nocardioides carbamazepini TaxID=2854259 RepID=UPI00214A8AB3|nr:SulP family inorganic anion transporter [Nocardioides carbamazepini]MCR1784957.1 SulP family inorganic anion transporter [Nocardioides carbamazepini]